MDCASHLIETVKKSQKRTNEQTAESILFQPKVKKWSVLTPYSIAQALQIYFNLKGVVLSVLLLDMVVLALPPWITPLKYGYVPPNRIFILEFLNNLERGNHFRDDSLNRVQVTRVLLLNAQKFQLINSQKGMLKIDLLLEQVRVSF